MAERLVEFLDARFQFLPALGKTRELLVYEAPTIFVGQFSPTRQHCVCFRHYGFELCLSYAPPLSEVGQFFGQAFLRLVDECGYENVIRPQLPDAVGDNLLDLVGGSSKATILAGAHIVEVLLATLAGP